MPSDQDLFGVFKEEKSIYVGDPFKEEPHVLSRHKGQTFTVPTRLKEPAPIPRAPEPYVDQYSLTKPGKVTTIHAKPFSPASPSKKPTGAGSLYGTIGDPRALLDTDPSVSTATKKSSDKEPAAFKRNIYVAPAKKGTFGFPVQDRTIGGNKFNFIPDQYERGRTLERELKKEGKAKMGKPFVSMGRTGNGIQPIPYPPTVGPDRREVRAKSADPSQAGKKPWKMSSPSAQGQGYGCISNIPYVPCSTVPQKSTALKGKGFKAAGCIHNRLSMWAPNPYQCAARPAPNNDISLLS